MLSVDFNIKPTLNNEVVIHKISDDEFVLHHTKLNHQIRVNYLSYRLISLLNGEKSIIDLSNDITQEISVIVDKNQVYGLLYKNLYKHGFIDNNPLAKLRESSNYLSLRFILIPKKVVNLLSVYLSFLIPKPKVFFIFFPLMSLFLVINMAVFINQISHGRQAFNFNEMTIVYIFLFGFLTCLFHELGHASSLRRYGKEAGNIGVGFFLFYPVFFCDVSEAWHIRKHERVVVNLGGIFFEFLISTLFLITFHITEHTVFILLSSIILLRTVLNLNPFLRRDGYWILSDLTNKPNLQTESINHFYSTVFSVFKKNKHKSIFNGFLFIYGFLSLSVMILFLLFVIIFNSSSIIYFPIKAWNILKDFLNEGLKIGSIPIFLKEFGLSILFYYLLIKMIFKQVHKRVTKIRSA